MNEQMSEIVTHLERAGFAIVPRGAAQRPANRVEIAMIIDPGAWSKRTLKPWNKKDADRRQSAAFARADAILAMRPSVSSTEAPAQAARGLTHIPTDLAGAINALIDYADDLDATERPAIGEYDVSADIRIVCQVAIDALSPVSSATRKWDEPDYEGCGVDTKRAVDRFDAERGGK